MSVEALKEQARGHEQNEQWQKALDLYIKAMDRMSEEDVPDIGLYNRAGDLATRTGASTQAVSFYERAVDYYVEAELPNNAIAVCKKVMRNLPDRYSIHLKIGQIRAAQGFITDARARFVTYAERVQADGDLDEAFRALIEFVDLAPDDYEIRQLLAAQLAQHERVTEAVQQLTGAHHIMVGQGMVEEAAQVETQILELDPDASLGAPPASGVAAGGDDGLAELDFDDAGADETAAPGEIEGDFAGLELGDGEDDGTPLPTFDFDEVGDADPGIDGEGEPEEVEQVEVQDDLTADTGDLSLSLDEEDEDEDAGGALTDLPLMSFDDEEPEATEAPEKEVELDAAAFGEADHGDKEVAEYVEGAEKMPEFEAGLEGLDQVEESDAEEAVEAAVEESVADAKKEEAAAEHEALAAEGDFLGAIQALSSVVEAEPDEQDHHQRMVEYAFRSNDSSALAEAYVGLAECLQRAGQDQRAKPVFEQALTSDPANERAKAGLGKLGEEAPAEAAQEVSSAESYVDLGSMLLGDDKEEKSTRFVVAYEEPTGDESADFQKMLSQFREKVSENIDADDVTAHYDLGTAFREMGLLDEAIAEFQQALRASVDHLPTYEMLGQTFLEKNEPEAALRSLTRALDAPFEIEDELMGIYYYLGQSHEAVGNKDQAVEFYDRVFSLDINFADVTERLRALRD